MLRFPPSMNLFRCLFHRSSPEHSVLYCPPSDVLSRLHGNHPFYSPPLWSSFFPGPVAILLQDRRIRYVGIFAATLYTGLQVFQGTWGLFDFLLPTLHIPNTHESYLDVRDWSSKIFQGNRELTLMPSDPRMQENLIVRTEQDDCSVTERRVERYEPRGKVWFRHEGGLFIMYRREEKGQWPGQGSEEIILQVFAWSSQPLKGLLTHIQAEQDESRTRIFVPRDTTRFPGQWSEIARKNTRGLDSIAFNRDKKSELVEDVRNFLGTESEYLKRNVPWRRGYLFHGPPGTGKTSLALALAHELGLRVYVVPVADSGITDANLPIYLRTMNRPSIILMDDIDSAGFVRAGQRSQGQDEERPGGLTRTGFLNGIDGVASPTGCIKIFTTNHIDKLDPAMIRSGRIDHQVHMRLASKTDAREIFMRFYSSDKENIASLADQFGEAVPSETLPSADIQDYLLRKKTPKCAVDGVAEWVKDKTGHAPPTQDESV